MTADPASTDIRSSDRTHLFLVATLAFAQTSALVKVRNLSPTGALIEGRELPPVGAQVVLRRGALEAKGRAVWINAGRAGLRFADPLSVTDWLPTRESARAPLAVATAPLPQPAATIEPSSRAGAVAADLSVLLEEVNALGGELMRDPDVAARHQLDWFDSAAGRLTRMIETLRGAVT